MYNNSNNTPAKFVEPLVIKDVRIVSKTRNFSGNNPGQYDKPGARNFSIYLDPEKVDILKLQQEGWNIKFDKRVNEDPDYVPPAYLRIHANWFPLDDSRSSLNPMIFKIVDGTRIRLDEDTVKTLDNDEILKCNITVTGRWMESRTYTGVVAYLKKMVVEVSSDDGMGDMFDGFDVAD
jgi:hypothetical protein